MKKSFLIVGALTILTATVGINSASAQAPAPAAPAAAPARTDRPRVAVFNVALVMKEFKKWQYWSNTMQNKRFDAQMDLMKVRAEVQELQKKIDIEPIAANKEAMAKQLVAKQREFEDKEATARKALDIESANLLKQMYTDMQQCVKAIVEANGYDVVFAHIDATTPEEATNPMLIDLKMRPNGAIPFYVGQSVDISKTLISTLNANFAPQGAIPALKGGNGPVPTGGTVKP